MELSIDSNDGMYVEGEEEYYYMTSLWAAKAIRSALEVSCVKESSVKNILDFACDYGRVARALCAFFPKAKLTVCDLDKKAVNSVSQRLNCDCVYGIRDLTNLCLNQKFSLIWVGSLFTNIDFS